MKFSRWVRTAVGVLLRDIPLYVRALAGSGNGYLSIRNRNEQLEAAPDGDGFRCLWQWTSDLHAPKVFPGLGLRVLKRALSAHPISMADCPEPSEEKPDISFIIGHRGIDRLPLLLATLKSIAGQKGVRVECLVVEQDGESRIGSSLPKWVRHFHTPPPSPDMPYCRSWAFNFGAKHARSAALVLHDNDLLVPNDYAINILTKLQAGTEVVNLKRFIFYQSEHHTKQYLSARCGLTSIPPVTIMQNAEGGGSIAIAASAYEAIGGMDEAFIGWGGEDNEFWERASSLKVWPYGSLPLVHLWHAPQSGKQKIDAETHKRYESISRIPVAERISTLRSIDSGQLSGPAGAPG